MNVLLSALLTLAPVWDMQLEPIEINPSIQTKLALPSSVDDLYIVLNFEETRELLLFRDDCLALTSTLTELDELHLKYRDALELKDIELEAKQKEVDLLNQKVDLLESALKDYENRTSWKPYAIVLGVALVGTLTYTLSR